MEILFNDGYSLKKINVTPFRRKAFIYSVSGFIVFSFVSLGGFIWSQSKLDSTEKRLAELETKYEKERLNGARIAEEVGIVASRAEDIGKAVGMLNLAFGALFSEDAVAIQEKENPEMAAFRRHLLSIQERYDKLKNNLAKMQADLAHGTKSSLSGNRERANNISLIKKDIEELIVNMNVWKEDNSFPDTKAYNNAKSNLQNTLSSLGNLETDIMSAVRRTDETLFGGTPAEVCMSDPDRTMIVLMDNQNQILKDYIVFSNLMFETMRQSLERSGIQNRFFDGQINNRIEHVNQQLNNAVRAVDDLMTDYGKLPLGAPVDQYFLTSGFGNRKNPFGPGYEKHEGLDFAAPKGTIAYSTAGGKVVLAGQKPGYGLTVEIEHQNGIKTLYGHMLKTNVKEGQIIKRGEIIGQVGSSGRSSGPHVHYEVQLDGKVVNPSTFLRAATLSSSCDKNEKLAKK